MEPSERTILVIDDEPDVVDLMVYNLEKAGFQTVHALSGTAGLATARARRPDAIILDLMLPGLNGFQVFEALKQDSRTKEIPVLMVTARAETTDKIAGLKAGVDDYLTKPFSPKELVLRVQALLKWAKPRSPEMAVESGPFYLDKTQLRCYLDGEPVDLTSTEFRLLLMLVEQAGNVVTRKEMFERVWGTAETTSRTLDTHLMRLREKLGSHAQLLQNIRGQGYRYGTHEEKDAPSGSLGPDS